MMFWCCTNLIKVALGVCFALKSWKEYLLLFTYLFTRAVTTIEADEAAASSDFLKKKQKQKNKKTKERERERERKKKNKRQDIDFCSSKGYIRYVMPFRIYFCVRCRMLFRIYFCSQSDVGSFLDVGLLISCHISEIRNYLW